MKLAYGSDLHLEFGMLELENKEKADVLILAGDVVNAEDARLPKYEWFFENISKEFPNTIYVMGNHEHYHGNFRETAKILKDALAKFPNIHFLDKQTTKIDDVTFFGATFWTSMNNRDPFVLEYIQQRMNDFLFIHNGDDLDGHGDNLFSTLDSAKEHEFTRNCLEMFLHVHKTLGDPTKVVVVGHHAPSRKSIHPNYARDSAMNYGYFSELDELILDHPEIKLFVHGHTHNPFDYKIGETRVLCNPRGYKGHELRADNFQLKTVEV